MFLKGVRSNGIPRPKQGNPRVTPREGGARRRAPALEERLEWRADGRPKKKELKKGLQGYSDRRGSSRREKRTSGSTGA